MQLITEAHTSNLLSSITQQQVKAETKDMQGKEWRLLPNHNDLCLLFFLRQIV